MVEIEGTGSKLKYALLAIVVAILLVIFFVFFQITGIRFIIGFLLMPLPFFLVLDKFKLDFDEKVIFSMFISLISFPLLVWYTNYFLVPSLRIAIFVVFFILIVIGILIRKFKKENI